LHEPGVDHFSLVREEARLDPRPFLLLNRIHRWYCRANGERPGNATGVAAALVRLPHSESEQAGRLDAA
jgi:hypothetical protein